MTIRSGRREALKYGGALAAMGLTAGIAYCAGPQSQTSPDNTVGLLRKLSNALDARDFGVTMSGQTDDSDALQKAVDAASRDKKILVLPGGTALLRRPLSLQGREISIVGAGMGRTVLKAGAAMDVLVDVREERDKIISPFELEGLSLDGAGMVQTVLAMRYRHHSVLRNLLCVGGKTGIFETDCWLSRRYNCRVERHAIGWHVERNGNSSLWEGCSFVACDDAHLVLGDGGDPREASTAILFRSCDVEFGRGDGVRIGAGTVVSFEDCYIGEAISGVVFDNSGLALVRGGTLFFGSAPAASLVKAAGGLITFRDLRINGHGHASLGTLVAPSGGGGRISLLSVMPAFPVAGSPTLPGAPIANGAVQSAVATQGRKWLTFGQSCAVAQRVIAGRGNVVTCTAATGPKPRFGLRAALVDADRMAGKGVYIALVYTSSVPLTVSAIGGLQASTGVPAFSQSLGHLPPATERQTYLKIDEKFADRSFSAIELAGDAAKGAWIGLESATVTVRTDPSNQLIDLITAA